MKNNGAVDFHSHILPGMDDGAKTPEESLQMLRMERDQGVDTVVLTPHFYRDRERPEQFLARRRASAEALRDALMALPEEEIKMAQRYSREIKNERIRLPEVIDGATCVWHQYVIRCEERDRLIDYLNEWEIGTIIHYPVPPHLAEAYRYLGHTEGFLPITEHLAKTVLSIPIYNGMTEEEQTYVIQALNEFE